MTERNFQTSQLKEFCKKDWYERSILKILDQYLKIVSEQGSSKYQVKNTKLAMKDNTAKEHFELIPNPNVSQILLYPLKSCLIDCLDLVKTSFLQTLLIQYILYYPILRVVSNYWFKRFFSPSTSCFTLKLKKKSSKVIYFRQYYH